MIRNKDKYLNKLILPFFIFSFILSENMNFDDIINFNISIDREEYKSGEYVKIIYDIATKNDYHIYSTDSNKAPIGGETFFEYYDSLLIKNVIDIKEPEPITKFDKNFNQNTSFHKGNFKLVQFIELNDLVTPDEYYIEGTMYATACNPSQCIRIIEDFDFQLKIVEGLARDDFKINQINISSELDKETDKGLIKFILFALGMGFFALLTPCVFPMIPITVSYFTKLGENNNSNPVKAASIYAIGIILIFSMLGLILALTLGASGAQQIAQNPWINLFIGFLFIFFAFSLFGYYELQAPQFLRQFSVKQESRSGVVGILFMSLTFTLTSFTCTVAFIGTLLVAASQGQYFWPIVGMVSFATAFSSPFFFLALFPQYLSRLPKSGGWLNTIKVTMGFLEIAAAFKFISNTDLVWNWQIFNREVVLFIWVGIIFLIGLYFLGVIVFPYDSKKDKISNKRILVVFMTFIFSFYLSTGLYFDKIYSGNSSALSFLSGLVESYLPPPKPKSYWVEDLELAYKISEKENKLMFLDFTGYTCTNCRWMEINIFEKDDVAKLFEEFVLVKLYTDGREEKHKEYRELEINRFKTAALPFYVILDSDDNVVSTFPGYNTDVELFKTFLKDALNK